MDSTTALCFVLDDDPQVGRLISLAVGEQAVSVEQFIDPGSLHAALRERTPALVFLNVALGASDAIEAIRSLSLLNFAGPVHLISDRDGALLADVRLIGERYGLRMRPALAKPLRAEALRRIVHDESPAAALPG
jgi:DNA-binding NtrC family response regulator